MTHPRSITAPPRRHFPWCTLLLAAATVIVSVFVAIDVGGAWLAKVKIVQLEDYGLRFSHLADFELWRLVTSQLIHVKQPHMIGDVVCLGLVGRVVERNVGPWRLLLLWLVGGALVTLYSTLFVPFPWNLGTGSSQAIMVIAGAGLWLALTGIDRSRSLLWACLFSIALAFAIDIVHVYYPKPHHVVGVVVGFLMAACFRMRVPERA